MLDHNNLLAVAKEYAASAKAGRLLALAGFTLAHVKNGQTEKAKKAYRQHFEQSWGYHPGDASTTASTVIAAAQKHADIIGLVLATDFSHFGVKPGDQERAACIKLVEELAFRGISSVYALSLDTGVAKAKNAPKKTEELNLDRELQEPKPQEEPEAAPVTATVTALPLTLEQKAELFLSENGPEAALEFSKVLARLVKAQAKKAA